MRLLLEEIKKSAVYGIVILPFNFLILVYTAEKVRELFGLNETIFSYYIESAKESGYIINYADCIGKLIPLTEETIKTLDLDYVINPAMHASFSCLDWDPPFLARPDSQEETGDVCRESENQMLPISDKGERKDVRVSEKDVRMVERWKKDVPFSILSKKMILMG